MKFVADKAIPHISEAFSTIGEVELLPAKEITAASLANADGLLSRTTVKITPDLLQNSSVTFIGTATIGTDHINLPYLQQQGIQLASAPGCNADAVGEYVLAALLELAQKKGIPLQKRTLGIIGAGNTGKAVKKRAEAIGIPCFLNDPPLAECSKQGEYLELDELLEQADMFSIHVPLTHEGSQPTAHLIHDGVLQRMKPGSIVINTSRGETIDGEALRRNRDRLSGIILDVWENEPEIDANLIPCVDIATPHIAGYSIEGKIRATEMIYREACRFFNQPATWSFKKTLEIYGTPELTISGNDCVVKDAVDQVYPILEDDSRLRRFITADKPGDYFADLRNHYSFRREFSSFQVNTDSFLSRENRELLSRIGFKKIRQLST